MRSKMSSLHCNNREEAVAAQTKPTQAGAGDPCALAINAEKKKHLSLPEVKNVTIMNLLDS